MITNEDFRAIKEAVKLGIKEAMAELYGFVDARVIDPGYDPRNARVVHTDARGQWLEHKPKRKHIPILLALGASLMFLQACASTRPALAHFEAPSVAPVKHAIIDAEKHVKSAQNAAQQLEQECAQKSAGWQSAYDSLQRELNDAYLATQTAQAELETVREAGNVMAVACNQVAEERATLAAKASELEQSRHGWVTRFWLAAGLCALLGAWTCRKLLKFLPLAAGI